MASLVKEIEKSISKNEDQKMAAFVNLLGEDREAVEEAAKKFVEKHGITNVPITVPVEFENGPKNFGINPDAEVTVMLYRGVKVVSNLAFAEGKLTKKSVKTVSKGIAELVEEEE